jgi:Carboxypeptidase regulatory-like domain
MRMLAMLFYLMSALQAAGEPVHISGTVIHGLSKQKLSGAQVYLTPSNKGQPLGVTTRADGRFEFTVPPGKYSLAGEAAGMQRQNFGGRTAPPDIAVSIIAESGLPTEDLIFPLFPSASIKGKVLDVHGDAVENALVHLMRKTVVAGKPGSSSYGWSYTNDLGEYRVGRLPPGVYYLAVNATPWYAEGNRRWRSALGEQAETLGVAFVPSYYPGTPDLSQAVPIVLSAGQEARGDFSLTPTRGAKITVNCKGCADGGALQLVYDGIGHLEEFQQVSSIHAGHGVLPAVPPGQYFVRVIPSQSMQLQAAVARLSVQGVDQTVELNASVMPSVSGVASMEGGVPTPKGMSVRIIHMGSGRVTSGAVGTGGSFRIAAVLPGPYEIIVYGTGLYTTSVRVGERDAKIFDIPDEGVGNLQIVAGRGGGSVKGVVYRDGKPTYGVLAVMVPESLSPTEIDRFHSFNTDSDGSFEWGNLAPGRYRLFAVDQAAFEYKVLETVRSFMKDAKLIEIGAGDTFRENIEISTSK